jgi:hypothetical protein
LSQLDVLKSLLRSSARSASAGLRSLPLAVTVQRLLSEAALGRATISDAQLTAAVARVPQVTAATVSSGHDRLRVDASFDDGRQLALALIPAGIAFAPGGAKEISFAVEPSEAALDPRSREVLAAIAGEIARSLWRAVLGRAPRSEQGGTVSYEDGHLVVDLRSVPEVRWAANQRLPAAVIEAIRPRAIEIHEGRLTLVLALDRLR